jgi:uncharacterized membrane protein (GlpM family)
LPDDRICCVCVRARVRCCRGGLVESAAFVTIATRPVSDEGGLAALRVCTVALLSLIFLGAGWSLVRAVHLRQRLEYCTRPWNVVDWLIILLAVYIVSEWSFFRVSQPAEIERRVCFWLAVGSPCLGVCTHCDPIMCSHRLAAAQ